MSKVYRVLVVDDDKKVCDLIAAFMKLGTKSIDISFAHDTGQATFKMENVEFDLVIIDKTLPGKSGKDFIIQLRKSIRYQKMKIIFMSGSLNNDDVMFSVNNKVNDVIVKPFKYAQFLEKLKKNLSPT